MQSNLFKKLEKNGLSKFRDFFYIIKYTSAKNKNKNCKRLKTWFFLICLASRLDAAVLPLYEPPGFKKT